MLKYISGGVTPVAIQTSARTMLELIAGTSKPVRLKRVGVSFNGSALAAGLLCELTRISASGTGTTVTSRPLDERMTVTAAAVIEYNSTVEPTTTFVLEQWYIQPTQGVEIWMPLEDEYVVAPAAGFGFRVTGAAGNVPICAPKFLWME